MLLYCLGFAGGSRQGHWAAVLGITRVTLVHAFQRRRLGARDHSVQRDMSNTPAKGGDNKMQSKASRVLPHRPVLGVAFGTKQAVQSPSAAQAARPNHVMLSETGTGRGKSNTTTKQDRTLPTGHV